MRWAMMCRSRVLGCVLTIGAVGTPRSMGEPGPIGPTPPPALPKTEKDRPAGDPLGSLVVVNTLTRAERAVATARPPILLTSVYGIQY